MPEPEHADSLGRIATVPNALSVFRLVLLATALSVLFSDHERVIAAVPLACAGVTDFLDGYLARRLGQVTTLGKVLDPTVDRVVLVSSIVAITVYGAVPIWLTGLVVGRELVVAGAALALACAGARRIDVIFIGKCAAFGSMVCFPLFLVAHGPGTLARALYVVTWVIMLPTLALLFVSAAAYLPRAQVAWREGRSRSVGSVS